MIRKHAQRGLPPILRGLIALAVATVVPLGAPASSAADEVFISVGTGALDGLYYALGKTICENVNRSRAEYGIRCSAEPTLGSSYNLERLATGELDLALVQSDAQHDAYNGGGTWKGTPFSQLRALLSFHTEFVALIVRQEKGARGLEDLKRARVNIGVAGSGTRATWEAIERAAGWPALDRAEKTNLRSEQAKRALCEGGIDANVVVTGHPAASVEAQLAECASSLVAIAGTGIEKLVRDHPYYRLGVIPAAVYGTEPIATFGPVATLVATAKLDTGIAASLTKAVLQNIAAIRGSLPALAELDRDRMVAEALSAPQHPGAKRAVAELGLNR